MDNQHRKINGYRDLTQAEIDLMNEIKAHAEKTRELVERVSYATRKTLGNSAIEQSADALIESMRWQRLAKDHLQQGYMCLTRAVAKPGNF